MNRNFARLVALVVLGAVFIQGTGGRSADEPKKAGQENPKPKIQATDSPAVIVERSIEAFGGKDKLARWNVGKLKYKPKFEGMPLPPEADITLEDTFQLPGHFKRVMRINVNGKELSTTWVINDGKGWQRRANGEATEIANEITKHEAHQFAKFLDVTLLTEKDVGLTVAGEQKVDGRAAILLQGESQKLGKVDFYFDPTTALLVKSKKLAPHPLTNKESLMEAYLSDYKDVQGGKVPMRIKGYAEGKLLFEITISEIQFHEKLDAKEFAKP